MRPDFKDKTSQRRQRRQTSVKQPSAHSTNFAKFFKQNWHIHIVFLLLAVLVFISIQLLNASPNTDSLDQSENSDNTIPQFEPLETETSVNNIVQVESTLYKPNQWQNVRLDLPPSEKAIYQNLLASHNLIDRTTDRTGSVEKSITPKIIQQTSIVAIDAGQEEIEEPIKWQDWRVKRGDNLAAMAKRYGVNAEEIYYLMRTEHAPKVLRKIFPKQIIKVHTSPQGEILDLHYDIEDTKRLVITRKQTTAENDNPFISVIENNPFEVQTAFAQGKITESLFLAGRDAGISDRMTMELAGIFGWDIDFVQDIRSGDRFSILYEERHREGQPLKGNKSEGAILAAEFHNNGRKLRAIRYTLPDGRTDYFTPEGNSLRKAFIRNPVDVARISSRFNLSRRHPILNTIRAHKGVDYAAPIGTPIRAAGDGKVVFRGKKGGYGNTIILQHGSRYSTLYAHMSKYARSTRNGQRVKQGQIIGYIGKTGLATGPHLHYEFRVNGVHRNPLTVKHPSVAPIPKDHMQQFLASTASINSQLDLVGEAQYALND